MRHGKAGKKLGRVTAHRWALFRNLLTALFRHERITTTEAKAKAVRGLADGMITLAKRESLHARRQVLRLVPDESVVKKLFGTVAARYAERPGGYTRIVRAGHRAGDNAPLVLLELVDRSPDKKDKDKTKAAEAAKGRRGKKQKAAAAAGS